jgi:hypothetical protein
MCVAITRTSTTSIATMPPLNINEACLSSEGFDTSCCSQPETEKIRNPLIIGMDDDSSSSSFARNYKFQRNVSFHQDISVIAVPRLHHAQEMYQRWYSRRELYLIKDNIRSLLRKHERRLLEQQEVLMASSSSFGDDCLFGLERHMTTEKAIIRQTKFNAKLAVFSEQFIQRQQGLEDATRIGMVYAAYAAQCQQHAITAALTNAMESSESSRPYEEEEKEEEGKTMDSKDEQDLYLGETKQDFSLANHFRSCWAWLS